MLIEEFEIFSGYKTMFDFDFNQNVGYKGFVNVLFGV